MSYAAEMIPQLIPTMPTENATYMWELNDAVREIKTVLRNQYKHILAHEDISVGYGVTVIECSPNKNMTINLPTAVGCAGKEYIIKNSKYSVRQVNYYQQTRTPSLITSDPSNGTLPWEPVTTEGYWQVLGPGTSGYKESHYLYGRGFGFNVPTGVDIAGIIVRIGIVAAGDYVWRDVKVYLTKAGSITGDNRATYTYFTAQYQYRYYGDYDDLWGTTWTPSDINNSGFGAKFAAEIVPYGRDALSIFSGVITVYYTTTTGVTYTIAIKPNGSETIDGQTQITFDTAAKRAYHIISDGANWRLVGVF